MRRGGGRLKGLFPLPTHPPQSKRVFEGVGGVWRRERERETDRQTDRQTDTQTHRQTDRQRQRETETERELRHYSSSEYVSTNVGISPGKCLANV